MYFPSTVTRYPIISKDAHHKVTYGNSVTLSCKYAEKSEKVQNQNGDEILTSAWLMFSAGTVINFDDMIVLPSGESQKVVTVHRIRDHMGREVCVEVYLAKGSI